jgi:hypothetical protein
MLQRFPYPPYTHDDMLEALKRNVPLLMMVSFVYTCINTVKVITVEKERQLKASNSSECYLEHSESIERLHNVTVYNKTFKHFNNICYPTNFSLTAV